MLPICVAWTRKNTWLQLGTTMLDTPWAAWTRETTWFQLRTTLLDAPFLGSLDTRKHVVPARDHHARYPSGKSGKSPAEETVSSYYTSGVDLLILSGSCAPPVWGSPDDHMLDTPLGGLDT